jgi:hypothetical protein
MPAPASLSLAEHSNSPPRTSATRKYESGRKPSNSSTCDRNILSPTAFEHYSYLFLPPFSCFVRFGPLTGHLLGGDVEAIPDIRRGDPEN